MYFLGRNIIFINNNVPAEDKCYLLYHETGHILLNHIKNRMSTKNNILLEIEADSFAYELINYTKPNLMVRILTVILITVLLTALSYSAYQKYNSYIHADMVYITSTGNSYHRNSCIYVKNRDCTTLERTEADKNYDPCKVCNP